MKMKEFAQDIAVSVEKINDVLNVLMDLYYLEINRMIMIQ